MPRSEVGLESLSQIHLPVEGHPPMRSRAYRSVSVKDVKIGEMVRQLAEGSVCAGLDVGKDHVMVVVRDARGTTLRPWKVRQTVELPLLVQRLLELSQGHSLLVAMEPTGTY